MLNNLKKGFKAKKLTKDEIDKAYTNNAIQYAHKARVSYQLSLEMEKHMDAMIQANADAMALPPEQPPTEPAPAQTGAA